MTAVMSPLSAATAANDTGGLSSRAGRRTARGTAAPARGRRPYRRPAEAADRVRVLERRDVVVGAHAPAVQRHRRDPSVAGVEVGVRQQAAAVAARAVDREPVERVADQPGVGVGGVAPGQAGEDRVVVVGALLLRVPATAILDLVCNGVAVPGV